MEGRQQSVAGSPSLVPFLRLACANSERAAAALVSDGRCNDAFDNKRVKRTTLRIPQNERDQAVQCSAVQ